MKKSFAFLLIIIFASQGVRSQSPSNTVVTQYIRSLLNSVDSNDSTTLLDGDLTQYAAAYSDSVDGYDARKLSNPGENIGMQRGAVVLAIERRAVIPGADSIFYKIWNLSPSRNYQLEFVTTNLNQPGLIGYLVDSYLNTNTLINLNGTTAVNFTINSNPASYNMYRFTLIYATLLNSPLPLTFTSVKAYQQNNSVKVDWQTANESNMKEYTVEKSADGNNFSALAEVPAGNLSLNNYSYTDASPSPGNNYYRIRSTDINDKTAYSQVMKVYIAAGFASLKVYPNPLTGNTVNLEMVNQAADNYHIRVMNGFGQVIMNREIQYAGGSSTQTFSLPQNIPHGIYQMEVVGAAGTIASMSLVY